MLTLGVSSSRAANCSRHRPRYCIAGVGQLQLLQPFFGLALAALLLGEPVAWGMIAVTGLVVLCVAGAKRYA